MEFFIEHKVGADEWREDSYEVLHVDVEPFVQGRLSGPPEDCYPSEGGYATGYGDVLWKKGKKGDGEKIAWEEFVQRYADYHDFKDDDPSKTGWPVSALEKAENAINEALYEAAEQGWQDAEEAAAEARYDELKDEGLI